MKDGWVRVNPAQGSGNKEVSVSSLTENMGRNARSTVLTFKAVNCADIQRTVIQKGMPEYVDIADTAAAPMEGKVVTISGLSNSRRLTFSLGTGDLELTLPESYMAAGVSTPNGTEIAGDPGGVDSYEFSIQFTVPANGDMEPLTRQVIVTDEGGHQDVCLLTLAAGEAYLRVQEGDINLDYLGTPVSVTVESNTEWTVE